MNIVAEKRPITPKVWMISAWLALAVIDGGQTVLSMYVQGMHHAWLRLFIMNMLLWLPWPVVTPYIISLGRRYPPRLSSFRDWGIHAALVIALLFINGTWSAWLDHVMDPWMNPTPGPSFHVIWIPNLYRSLLPTLVLYTLILAIDAAVRSLQTVALQKIETARMNEQLANAQLDALRQQIEPHFLFNTLNAVVGLMREKRTDAAINAVVGLSDFLRGSLRESNRPFVTLREELDLLRPYLDIQKTRFGERLKINIDIADEVLSIEVPGPILQPLVENAIKHGIEKRERGGSVLIKAWRVADRLHLTVGNDGPPLTTTKDTAVSGVGNKNLRTRLQILYGDKAELKLCNCEGGVEAVVTLPVNEN